MVEDSDFEWAEDVPEGGVDKPFVGMRWEYVYPGHPESNSGHIYTIKDMDDTHMYLNWLDDDGDYVEDYEHSLEDYFKSVDEGNVKLRS